MIPILNPREVSEIKELMNSNGVYLRYIDQKNDLVKIVHPEFEYINSSISRNDSSFTIKYFHTTNNREISIDNIDFKNLKYYLGVWFRLVNQDYPKIIDLSNGINRLSGNYYAILKEAISIKNLGFDDSSGMIFRKALEILIKDYFLFLLPSYEEDILKKTVGGLIRYFFIIKDGEFIIKEDKKSFSRRLDEIKNLCKKIDNTFAIGNDFSHYERKLDSYTSDDLYSSILKIERFIDIHVQEEYLNDLRGFLDSEFDSEASLR